MDTIGNFITVIRNAQMAGHHKVDTPSSKVREGIARVLKQKGFIRDFRIAKDNKQGFIRVYLKYTKEGRPLIDVIRRVSRPGLRKYVDVDNIPEVRSGYGVSILSTNKGIMSDKEARENKVGGEVMLKVW